MATSVSLTLNHPVKALVWVGQENTVATASSTITSSVDATLNVQGAAMSHNNDYFNYMAPGTDNQEYVNDQLSDEHFAKAKLNLNGHDRFAQRNASYFRTVTPLQAGLNVPSKHIYVYSFALEPQEHQPSGTCNFSRIDSAQLKFSAVESNSDDLHVYAVNYNVLRIMSGMGGLAYSN